MKLLYSSQYPGKAFAKLVIHGYLNRSSYISELLDPDSSIRYILDLEQGHHKHVARDPLCPRLVRPQRRGIAVNTDMHETPRFCVRGNKQTSMRSSGLGEAHNVEWADSECRRRLRHSVTAWGLRRRNLCLSTWSKRYVHTWFLYRLEWFISSLVSSLQLGGGTQANAWNGIHVTKL
jgi:hypothetical protein